MPTAMSRRKTLPLDKNDRLLEIFLSRKNVKTQPVKQSENSGLQTVSETEVVNNFKDKPRTSLKRTDSYKRATERLSIYDESLEGTDHGFRKESYDARKYSTLPKDMGSLERPLNKKKKGKQTTKTTTNNNNNNNESLLEKRKYNRELSGHVPSSDSDDEDETAPKKARKKKSAFQKAKDRILQTFRIQANRKIEKIKKEKKQQKRKRSPRHRATSIEEIEIIGEGGRSVVHVSQKVEDQYVENGNFHTDLSYQTDKRVVHGADSPLKAESPAQRFKSFRQNVRRKFSFSSKYRDEKYDKTKNIPNDQVTPSNRMTPSSPVTPSATASSPVDDTTKDLIEAFISQNDDCIGNFNLRESWKRGDRSRLHLEGLIPNRPVVPYSCTSDYTRHVVVSPTGKVKVNTNVHQEASVGKTRVIRQESRDVVEDGIGDELDFTDGLDKVHGFDDVDGAIQGFDVVDGPAGSPTKRTPVSPGRCIKKDKFSNIPFDRLPKEEKNERIQNVASRLIRIADQYVSNTESSSEVESPKGQETATKRGLSSLEVDLIKSLREEGDRLSGVFDMPSSVMPFAIELVKEASYNKFKTVIESSTKGAVGWNEIAMCMYLTKAAVRMAGAGGTIAGNIKDSAATYLSDTFSKWIIDKGGWESVFEETDSELD